jgi:hypothetical protein
LRPNNTVANIVESTALPPGLEIHRREFASTMARAALLRRAGLVLDPYLDTRRLGIKEAKQVKQV